MLIWFLGLLQISSAVPPPTTPAAVVETAECLQGYSYTDWEQVREEHRFEGTWVVAYRHYQRTRTNQCTKESEQQSRVEGPIQLWPAVPHLYTQSVSAPKGDTAVSGTPLRTADPPYSFRPIEVGPKMDVPESRTRAASDAGAAQADEELPPDFTGLWLLGGILGYMIANRRRMGLGGIVALGGMLVALITHTAYADTTDHIPFETHLGPIPEPPVEPVTAPEPHGIEFTWYSPVVGFVADGVKRGWLTLALVIGSLLRTFGLPWKGFRSVWDRMTGARKPNPVFSPRWADADEYSVSLGNIQARDANRRDPGPVSPRTPFPPICRAPSQAEITVGAAAFIERFYGFLPGTAGAKLSPSEVRFMADFLRNAQNSGDTTAYGRTHPDDYARFFVLAHRLHGLNRDPWRSQQEIALATGLVYPVWELLTVESGSLERSPSPLGMPPEAVFPTHGDGRQLGSFLVSVSPVGDYYDGLSAITGRDPITGESLQWWERTLAALGIIPLIPGKAMAEALGMIRKGDRAADIGRVMAADLIRKALPDLTAEGAANLVRFMEWADNRMMTKHLALATEELAQTGAGPMIAKWISELEPEEAVRMIEHYTYNKHLLGVLNEARMGQQIKKLVADQKALLLHFNEAVTHGGADLIWIDLTSNRVVFADVKASVSGTTISRVKTFQKRMEENIETARRLIDSSPTLTEADKDALLKALDLGDFDLQVVLAGTAEEAANLAANLLESLKAKFPKVRVRDKVHLDN